MARILVVEAVELYCEGLKGILEGHDVVVVRPDPDSFEDGADVAVVSTSTPTLQLADQVLFETRPPVILHTGGAEWERASSLIESDRIRAIVYRDSPRRVLAECVERVCRGRRFVDSALARWSLGAEAEWLRGIGATPKEIEVLNVLNKGLSGAPMARELGCSERTVKFHISNLLRKSGVSRRQDLVDLSRRLEIQIDGFESHATASSPASTRGS